MSSKLDTDTMPTTEDDVACDYRAKVFNKSCDNLKKVKDMCNEIERDTDKGVQCSCSEERANNVNLRDLLKEQHDVHDALLTLVLDHTGNTKRKQFNDTNPTCEEDETNNNHPGNRKVCSLFVKTLDLFVDIQWDVEIMSADLKRHIRANLSCTLARNAHYAADIEDKVSSVLSELDNVYECFKQHERKCLVKRTSRGAYDSGLGGEISKDAKATMAENRHGFYQQETGEADDRCRSAVVSGDFSTSSA